MKVELLSKPQDDRSAAARASLERLKGSMGFELALSEASQKDRERAPVVRVDGREVALGSSLDEESLRRVLKAAADRAGVSRRGKLAFAVAAGLSLVSILALKGYQVFIEPSLMEAKYLGLAKLEGPAPDFVMDLRDGRKVKLSDFRGKYVFLNYWATWCDSCRVEMPSMVGMLNELRTLPMVSIAATVDDTWEPVDKFLAGRPWPFLVLRDPEAKWAHTYGTTKFPETYVIGPDGQFRGKFIGPRDWSDKAFSLYFRKLLGGAGGAQAAAR